VLLLAVFQDIKTKRKKPKGADISILIVTVKRVHQIRWLVFEIPYLERSIENSWYNLLFGSGFRSNHKVPHTFHIHNQIRHKIRKFGGFFRNIFVQNLGRGNNFFKDNK